MGDSFFFSTAGKVRYIKSQSSENKLTRISELILLKHGTMFFLRKRIQDYRMKEYLSLQ